MVVSMGGIGKTANTTNLKYHLKKNHPEIEKVITENKKELVESTAIPSTSCSKSPTTLTIPSVFESMKTWDAESLKAKEIHKLIGEFIAIDNQPFSVVNDVGFNRIIKKAFPSYKVPSDKYFRQNILPDMYHKCRESIAQKLNNLKGKISLTTDIWTCNHNNKSFLSLVGHFIDLENEKNMSRSSIVLACKPISGSHTGNVIADELNELLESWKLDLNKVHLIIADNAANIKKGINLANLKYESCFVHSLQLVVNKSLESQQSVDEVLAISRRIVAHFNHSSSACDKLNKIQEQLNMPHKKLIQDIQTRWNSTFYMLERLLEQKRAIRLYIIDNPNMTDLNAFQWELVENILNLLKPFEEITKIASSPDCCISEIIPLVLTLKSYLGKDGSNFLGVGIMRKALSNTLNKRFEGLLCNDNFLFATYLDPRFKTKFFDKNTTQKVQDDIKFVILNNSDDLSDIQHTSDFQLSDSDDNIPLSVLSQVSGQFAASANPSNAHKLFWDSFEEFVGVGSNEESSSKIGSRLNEPVKQSNSLQKIEQELQLYSQIDLIYRNDNPYTWWENKKEIFPMLFSQTLIYISSPPGSVSSEQLFSQAGNVHEATRNRLNPDIAENLIFLHCNLPKLNYQY